MALGNEQEYKAMKTASAEPHAFRSGTICRHKHTGTVGRVINVIRKPVSPNLVKFAIRLEVDKGREIDFPPNELEFVRPKA